MIAMRFSRTCQRFGRLLKTDDTGERFTVFQHVHDLDAGAFHFVQHRIHARRKITVGDECRRGDDQAGRSREQTFVNPAGELRDSGVAAVRSDRSEGVDHSRHRSEQAKQWREKSQRRQNAKKALEFRNLQLPRFLHNFAQLRPRRIMPQKRGVNHARDRAGRPGRFVQRFREIAALDQIRKSFQEFTDVDGGAVQIKEALGEDSDGDNATGQNRPHEQSALLDVINHGGYLLSSFSLAGQAARSSAGKRATRNEV